MEAWDPQELIAELCHQINSPLAAVRNALYLSACRTRDPELLRYLAVADEEISSIAATLRNARCMCEACEPLPASRPSIVSRRAAA